MLKAKGCKHHGAANQSWTGDLILTKDALYQLSYCSFFTSKRGLVSRLASAWFSSGRRGSNPPPIAWKAIALPNELLPLLSRLWGRVDSNHWTPKRTDLQSVAIATMRLPHLFVPSFPVSGNSSRWRDSNPRQADYKSATLPTELHRLFTACQTTLVLLIWGCKDTRFFRIIQIIFIFFCKFIHNDLFFNQKKFHYFCPSRLKRTCKSLQILQFWAILQFLEPDFFKILYY